VIVTSTWFEGSELVQNLGTWGMESVAVDLRCPSAWQGHVRLTVLRLTDQTLRDSWLSRASVKQCCTMPLNPLPLFWHHSL